MRRSALGVPLALTVLLTVRLVLAVAIVPRWQGPDEPRHFLLVRILSQQEQLDLTPESDHNEERSILSSMAAHDWWWHYGVSAPMNPSRFIGSFAQDAGRYGDVFGIPSGPVTYYRAGAAALRTLGITRLTRQYDALRILSIVCGVASLWCVWRASAAAFGRSGAAAISTLLALHPQFALVSTTVSPDALVNLLGAVVWLQAVRLTVHGRITAAAAWLWSAAIAATMVRRLGAPLLVMAVQASLTAMHPSILRHPQARRYLIAAALVITAVAGAVFALGLADVPGLVSGVTTPLPAGATRERPGLVAFTRLLVDSSWMYAGWLRYPLPAPARVLVYLVTAAGVIGTALAIRRATGQTRRVLLLAAGFAAIQLVAVYVLYFEIMRMGPQGRYLFPAMAPGLTLLWAGWMAWFPERSQATAVRALVAIVAVIDVVSWTWVLGPVYLA